MRVLPLVAKKKALEPLSMKAEEVLPVVGYLVSNSPKAIELERGCLAQPIMSRVPMPNTKAPVTLGAPSAEIVGNSIMVPLLSWLKTETGFSNCLAVGTAATTQPPFFAEEHA